MNATRRAQTRGEKRVSQWKNRNINIITNKMLNKSFVGRTSDWIGANKFVHTNEFNNNDGSVAFVFTPEYCFVFLCLSNEEIT